MLTRTVKGKRCYERRSGYGFKDGTIDCAVQGCPRELQPRFRDSALAAAAAAGHVQTCFQTVIQ
jgi:hypothetical protein